MHPDEHNLTRCKPHTDAYARIGFPGAICSFDGVHVAWDRCPASQDAVHRGKEGYPSRVFNVAVSNSKKILSWGACSFPGARNDKTVARFCPAMQAMYHNKKYAHIFWERYDKDGDLVQMKGLYAIVDGGYHN